jgi:addiction module HigA family antidote
MIQSFSNSLTEKIFNGDKNKVPKPAMNPAGSLIEDTIAHHSMSQKAAAEALGITPQLLNNVIKRNQAVSVDLAMRMELCFKLRAEQLIRLQSTHDYRVAYHGIKRRLRSKPSPKLTRNAIQGCHLSIKGRGVTETCPLVS